MIGMGMPSSHNRIAPMVASSLTSTAFPNSCIYGSSSGIDLILPSVDHRVAVEIIDELHDALFELVF